MQLLIPVWDTCFSILWDAITYPYLRCLLQYSAGWNYLSLPEMPASVFCTVFCGMQLLIPAWDARFSILHSILWDAITYPCLRYLLQYSAQYSVGCNYLSLPEITVSVFCGMQLLIPTWDTCFSILHSILWDTVTYPCLGCLLQYSAQYSVGFNYFSLPEIPVSVFCAVFCGMQLLIPTWDTCFSILHNIPA